MKQKIFLIFIVLFSTTCLVAQTSNEEQNSINQLNYFKMELEKYDNPQVVLDKISVYENRLFTNENYKSFSEETKLVLENMLFLEKLKSQVKLLGADKSQRNKLKENTSSQIQKTANLISLKKNSNQTPSKWLLVTQGDLISYSLQFATLTQAIKSGLEVKTYYEDALKQDQKMSFALINIGMWYYYVPGIAGGDKQKTYEYVEKSVLDATNDSELYFAKIIYSQTLFEQEKYEQAKLELELAKKLCPESLNIKFMEKLNNAGISYIEYSANPKKYDKKLK